MLILTRKTDEEILIGSDIVVKIISVSEGKVKLGISAPGNVKVFRGEVYKKIKETTIEASIQSRERPAGISKLKINKLNE